MMVDILTTSCNNAGLDRFRIDATREELQRLLDELRVISAISLGDGIANQLYADLKMVLD